MTDAPDLSPTPDDDPADFDPREIAEEARKSFSLSDRLKGIKHTADKIVLYTDVKAVSAYSALNREIQAITDAAGRIKINSRTPADERARHEQLVERATALEEQMDEAREAMLAGALSVHLQAFPNVVVKMARREARKVFSDPVTGQIPEDRMSDVKEFIDLYLVGNAIAKVVDSGGEILDLGPREKVGKLLSDDLPPTQWQRLYDKFTVLTLTDEIGSAATDDPGF